jgi:hypothetical protein
MLHQCASSNHSPGYACICTIGLHAISTCMRCCTNVDTRCCGPSADMVSTAVGDHGCVSSIMVVAVRHHVHRLSQHSGPQFQIFKPCNELRVYIWASQESIYQFNYLANVHQKGQLCTCRPLTMPHRPSAPPQPVGPRHPRKLQVSTRPHHPVESARQPWVSRHCSQHRLLAMGRIILMERMSSPTYSFLHQQRPKRPAASQHQRSPS